MEASKDQLRVTCVCVHARERQRETERSREKKHKSFMRKVVITFFSLNFISSFMLFREKLFSQIKRKHKHT